MWNWKSWVIGLMLAAIVGLYFRIHHIDNFGLDIVAAVVITLASWRLGEIL